MRKELDTVPETELLKDPAYKQAKETLAKLRSDTATFNSTEPKLVITPDYCTVCSMVVPLDSYSIEVTDDGGIVCPKCIHLRTHCAKCDAEISEPGYCKSCGDAISAAHKKLRDEQVEIWYNIKCEESDAGKELSYPFTESELVRRANELEAARIVHEEFDAKAKEVCDNIIEQREGWATLKRVLLTMVPHTDCKECTRIINKYNNLASGEFKHCPKCGLTKRRSEFSRNNSVPGGLQVYCKECAKEYQEDFKLQHAATLVNDPILGRTDGLKACKWEGCNAARELSSSYCKEHRKAKYYEKKESHNANQVQAD
jgi:hypothetical protein